MKNIFLLFFVMVSAGASAQNPAISLQSFSSGYSNPVDIENCGDNRLFIVERSGKIWICDANGNKSATPFLDISAKVYTADDEQGLLGLAFHPQYKSNGYFYVNYINKQQNTVIARYKVSFADSNKAKPSTQFNLLFINQPFSNHNGGCLKFGPDGYLYIGMGDGGSGGDPYNNAQNTKKLLGKMLRIDVDNGTPYAIPATNPFVNVVGYKAEIWALGLRNPWRFSFDHSTGDLWIGDVGQNLYEEVDYQPANDTGGENYGWRCYEANHVYNNSGCGASSIYTFPIVEIPHNPDCAIIGGFVYRGTLYPNMTAKYFYTDNCSGIIRMIYYSGGWQNINLGTFLQYSYSSFGEDKNQELYLASLSDGKIYHVTDASLPLAGRFSITSGAPFHSLIIYPNPAHGNFMVAYAGHIDGSVTLCVTNSVGQDVLQQEMHALTGMNTFSINASGLAKGIYLVTIGNSTQKQMGRLIIE